MRQPEMFCPVDMCLEPGRGRGVGGMSRAHSVFAVVAESTVGMHDIL